MTTQVDQNNDSLNNTNSLIAYNLQLLTTYSVNQYNNLYEDNVKLTREIRFLKDDLDNIKKRKRDDENKIQHFSQAKIC